MAKNGPDIRPRRGCFVLAAAAALLLLADGPAWSRVHWGSIRRPEAPPKAAPAEAESAAAAAMNKAFFVGALEKTGSPVDPELQVPEASARPEAEDRSLLVAAASAEATMHQALSATPRISSVAAVSGAAGLPPGLSRAAPPQFPALMNDPRYRQLLSLAGANTQRSGRELARVLEYSGLGLSELESITGHLRTATAEYVMASGAAALDITAFVAGAAVRDLKNFQISTLPNPLFQRRPVQPAYGEEGEEEESGQVRLWGGYLGRFRSVDGGGSYYGYDQNSSGGLIGVSYELGPTVSLGVYTGFSKSKVKFDALASNNRSNGLHLGLIGRFAPLPETDPGFSVYGDLGYASYNNEGRRYVGQERVKASYGQKALTAGLGLDYVAQLNFDIRLTPSLDLRYTRLKQDEVRERGFAPLNSRVDGFTADSITSTLALAASTEIDVRDGTVTPMIKVGWQHEYGDKRPRGRARYAGLGAQADPYRISSVAVDRDAFMAGLGFMAILDSGQDDQVALNFNYDFLLSRNSRAHSLYGGLEYRF